ncbi:MAG: hypothetical protein ABL898_12525 [Hyphomicrobiaceae bacterium]
MKTQRKTAILLTLACCLIGAVLTLTGTAIAQAPSKTDTRSMTVVDAAYQQALDLLRRDAAKTRPDWMVTATAKTGRWDFSVVYTKGKGLLLPVLNSSNSNATPPVPPLTDLVLPQNASVGIYVTSSDDIRPFEVPGLGIKTDALPDRIEQVAINTAKLGVYPATCVSHCGPQEKSMTFNVHIVDMVTFKYWLATSYAASSGGR